MAALGWLLLFDMEGGGTPTGVISGIGLSQSLGESGRSAVTSKAVRVASATVVRSQYLSAIPIAGVGLSQSLGELAASAVVSVAGIGLSQSLGEAAIQAGAVVYEYGSGRGTLRVTLGTGTLGSAGAAGKGRMQGGSLGEGSFR
jgi:hypothetical protein